MNLQRFVLMSIILGALHSAQLCARDRSLEDLKTFISKHLAAGKMHGYSLHEFPVEGVLTNVIPPHGELGKITPLMVASYYGWDDLVQKMIIENPVCEYINAQDDQGRSALHYAILGSLGWPKKSLSVTARAIVRLLKRAGAYFDLKDTYERDAQSLLACIVPEDESY